MKPPVPPTIDDGIEELTEQELDARYHNAFRWPPANRSFLDGPHG